MDSSGAGTILLCTRPALFATPGGRATLLPQVRPVLPCPAMQEVVVTKTFAAPRRAVWSVYTDHLSWNDWARIGKVRLEREGRPSRNGVGCVRVISSGGISVHEEVLSFEEPEKMTYRVLRGGLPIKNHFGEVRFDEAASGRTTVTWRCRFDSRIPGLGFLWKAIITKVFRDTLGGLASGPFGKR